MDGRDAAAPGSFHGRRKGKALRAAQERRIEELLPDLRIRLPGDGDPRGLPLTDRFDPPVRSVELEIGFGGGEHLAAQARTRPEVGFIGCEPFVNGMAKLLGLVEAEGLRNVRLWDADAARLLPALPAASLDRVYLLFPDPWPKRRQRKRRFVSDDSLGAIARVLKPGGEFRFASDIDDYVGWTLARIARSIDFQWEPVSPDAWRCPPEDWPGTRYEAKAGLAGRPASYLTFRRT